MMVSVFNSPQKDVSVRTGMVERVPWFSPIHYEIMIFFEAHNILVSPAVVAVNIGYQRSYTNVEMKNLTRVGLLRQTDDGFYELGEVGEAFLNGKVDSDDIPEPE